MHLKGYLSYAHSDDVHLNGAISRLRDELEQALSMFLGNDVEIFQDKRNIMVSDTYLGALDATLSDADFFVPIMTPRYFNSDFNQEELSLFLQNPNQTNPQQLVFPIYLISDKAFDNGKVAEPFMLLRRIQYQDIRSERFSSDPSSWARTIETLARQIAERLRDALQADTAPAAAGPDQVVRPAVPDRRPSPRQDTRPAGGEPSGRNRVFVNYRTEDAGVWALLLAARLEFDLGENRIFHDISNIPPGIRLRDHLKKIVQESAAMVVVIGPTWLQKLSERLAEDSTDYVLLEIEEALAQEIEIIPVLIEGAGMPREHLLPDEIKVLADYSGVPMTVETFRFQYPRLSETIRYLVELDED